jgi:hypothetical protein
MATSKTRSEGFRAQTLEYIREHPGVSSTDLRTKAEQFGTDEDKLSKTLWAMTACGLVVQKRIDPTKKVGPVQYWVPEAAPAELKAEVKLARQLQKSGLTMTELRKQQAGTVVAKKSSARVKAEKSSAGNKAETAAPVSGKATRLSRKTSTAPVEPIEVAAPKAPPEEQTTAPERKKRGPYKKTKTSSSERVSAQEQTPPVVTPISLEQPPVGAQPSLFEEPSLPTKAKRGRPAPMPADTANTPPTQPAAASPAAVPFAPVLDLSHLAAAFQPFAGALSDILANMVIGQTLQKVQQGLGGVSLALAQGTPQLAIPPAATPSPEDALTAFASLQAAAPAAYAAPAAAHVPPAASPEAPAASGPVTSAGHDTAEDGEAGSEASLESDAQAAPRPVLHVASVREVPQKKPKVLVVGLLPNQAGIVQSEFYEAFDIRFAESDTPTKRLESMASDCDRVMLMTNFISHSTQDAVKKHPGFERIQGGVSKVKDRLTELFIASEEAA